MQPTVLFQEYLITISMIVLIRCKCRILELLALEKLLYKSKYVIWC